jgi:hypothetical protein
VSHIIGKGRYAGETYPSPPAAAPVPADDHKVAVTAADTTPDYLAAKLAAGPGIALALVNPGANEHVRISATGADERVKVSAADTTPGFLATKLVSDGTIDLTVLSPGGDEKLEIKTRIRTFHAESAAAFPLPTFPALTAVATTAPIAIAAGERVLTFSRVLAEITAGGSTMATAVFAAPIAPPGAPFPIDTTETTVAPPKQTISSAGVQVTLPAGTYTFSLVVSSLAPVAGFVPAIGPGFPISPAVLTVMVLPP